MSAGTVALCSTFLFVFVSVSADQKIITAKSGQNVTLTCRDKSNTTAVKWCRADLRDKYILLYKDGHFVPGNQHPSFEYRVDLQDKRMRDGDVSLILKNVKSNDTGTYECRVFMNGSYKSISIIKLCVSPGQTGGVKCASRGQSGTGSVGLTVSALLLVAGVVVF